MNPSQYRKLPRHFISNQTFLIDLTQHQAETLAHLLPKGCTLAVQSKSKLKQVNQKVKQEHLNINQQVALMQSSSIKSHHVSKQSLVPKNNQKIVNQKKPQKQQILQIVKPCISILQQLKNYKHSWPFLEPVDAQALGIPQYFQIIAQPMDLSTIQKKIKSGQYKAPIQFYRDVNLMIKNSYDFNEGNDQFLKITNDFQKYFFRIAGAQAKPSNDKKLQKEKQKQKERLQRERIKEQKLKQKILQKQKQIQRKRLLQQQQQAQMALRLAKKKKKMIPKDILQAQNISVQEKQQLANNIHSLQKQHIKGIRQIVFGDIKQDQNEQRNTNQFDIQKIGYKKIRQLQKYVKLKLLQMQNTKLSDEQVQKKNQIDLDQMESQWTEQFVD